MEIIRILIQVDINIWICLYNWIHVIYREYSCILSLNITKAGFQWKPRIFFLFCDLDFIDFFDGFSGIQGYFDRINWKPWVVFMKPDKKKLKPLRRHAGPSGLRSGLRSGPRAQPVSREVSTYFFYWVSWNPTYGDFRPKIGHF